MSTRDRLREIVAEEAQWADGPETLTDDLLLVEQHVLDSLALMRLVARLEDEFAIEVDDEDIVPSNFGTIARLGDYVDANR